MIKIEKAESYRICSHCYSKNDVMNINIRYQCTNTGTQITLCKECCESMVNEIRRVDLNPKAAAVKDEDDTERRAPSAQRWIPCSERLPEPGVYVLVDGADIPGGYRFPLIDKICDDGEWLNCDGSEWSAVAWMSIPEPWKGERDG